MNVVSFVKVYPTYISTDKMCTVYVYTPSVCFIYTSLLHSAVNGELGSSSGSYSLLIHDTRLA